MQKFYFSFIFHSKLGVSYFLPLKVISKDKISACHCYEAMKVALSQSFTVDSSEEPIEETLGFISPLNGMGNTPGLAPKGPGG